MFILIVDYSVNYLMNHLIVWSVKCQKVIEKCPSQAQDDVFKWLVLFDRLCETKEIDNIRKRKDQIPHV